MEEEKKEPERRILDYKDLKDARDIIKLETTPILQFGVHRASASSYGKDASAKLCQIIVDSNTAFMQEVMDNKVDLFDTLDDEELMEVDDLGIYLNSASLHPIPFHPLHSHYQYMCSTTLNTSEYTPQVQCY